jgi:hypothetical protein
MSFSAPLLFGKKIRKNQVHSVGMGVDQFVVFVSNQLLNHNSLLPSKMKITKGDISDQEIVELEFMMNQQTDSSVRDQEVFLSRNMRQGRVQHF